MTEPRWTLGVLVGLPVAALIALSCLAIMIGFIRARAVGTTSRGDATIGAIGFGIAAAITIGITAVAMIPWNAAYHQWRPVSGVVEQTSSRMIRDGEGMSERYVLVINRQPYGIDDTRASLVNEGDTVHLSCIKEWQWASNPGFACRWGG